MFKNRPIPILGSLPPPPPPKAGAGRSGWRVLWAGLPSMLFKLVVLTRHKLYDFGLFKSEKGALPSIVIGNLTVGGTGKTPHVRALIEALELTDGDQPPANRTRWAMLSRGYRRNTNGFKWVESTSRASEVGDEPLEVAWRFPTLAVAVCENRPQGIATIAAEDRADAVLLDDAFQHRALQPDLSIVLVDVKQPVDIDRMLPLGRLRDVPKRLQAADVVILTRCNERLIKGDLRLWRDRLGLRTDQIMLHTAMRPKGLQNMYTKDLAAWPKKAAVVSGIARPKQFLDFVGAECSQVQEFVYPDHHPFTATDLEAWRRALNQGCEAIVTTEKDAARIREVDLDKSLPVFVLPIEVQFLDEGGIDSLVEQIRRATQRADEPKSKANELNVH
ncbi:MAG: tetraacyldisaccharide 4'-kinase [Flavobacteriales bacterium]|nr:tetraacyldisaccharide 4'-kinase [Flavobacteriales bacterium]